MLLQKRLYYINSRNRLTGTDSNFEYKLDMIDLKSDRVVLMACNIPKSYYLIQDGENVLTLQEGLSTADIVITPGNYSRTQLKNVLQTTLNSSSPSGFTYTITTPSTLLGETGLYTFLVTNNGGVQPDFIFTDNNIFEVLGFDINSTNNFLSDTLISTNVIKLQKEDTIFIHSDICTNGNDNILQEIYATSSATFGNIVYYTPDSNAYSKKLTSNNNNIFNFWLSNEDNEPINLNGQNWSFTLMVFKEDDRVFKFIKAYAKVLNS